jgi:hypothetical protein
MARTVASGLSEQVWLQFYFATPFMGITRGLSSGGDDAGGRRMNPQKMVAHCAEVQPKRQWQEEASWKLQPGIVLSAAVLQP